MPGTKKPLTARLIGFGKKKAVLRLWKQRDKNAVIGGLGQRSSSKQYDRHGPLAAVGEFSGISIKTNERRG